MERDLRDVVSVLTAMCVSVGTPRALAVKLLAEGGEWDQLVSLRVEPHMYESADAYFLDAQVTDLLRKCKGLPLAVDLNKVAVETFYKCEQKCYVANERLSPYLDPAAHLGPAESKFAVRIANIRRSVRHLLGPLPARLDGRLGPGATFSDKGAFATTAHKFSSVPSLTRGVVPLLKFWDDMWSHLCDSRGGKLSYVLGNRFTSVPKDSTKNRGICIEPSLNLWFQLSVGKLIRNRLKRCWGIDLDSGQSKHRRIACDASRYGHLATIDLSNASDTVCSNLVKLLLPADWYELLVSLRSPYTFIEGKWMKLEKFSSMGNGFTFELETLIFAAIMGEFAPSSEMLVYGDDMIVNVDESGVLLDALKYFGFEPNTNKSFVNGPFRESCGGDYFNGVAVRPFQLKEIPNEPQKWIAFANGIFRAGLFGDRHATRVHTLRSARERCLSFIPVDIRRCRGPQDLGDLLINDHLGSWNYRSVDGMRMFRVYQPVASRRVSWRNFTPHTKLASVLYGVGADERGIIPRDAVAGYRLGWTAYS